MKKITSRWWEFKISGEKIDPHWPYCFQANNLYVEWYVNKEFIQGWIQSPCRHTAPISRLPKNITVVYNKIKYTTITATYPITGCERYTLGTFTPQKQKQYKKSTNSITKRPRKMLNGASYFKLTPDHLLPVKTQTSIKLIFNEKGDIVGSTTPQSTPSEASV